jgi:hypothetical protein
VGAEGMPARTALSKINSSTASQRFASSASLVVPLVSGQVTTQPDWDVKFLDPNRTRLRSLFLQAESCSHLPVEFGQLDPSYPNTSETWPEQTKQTVKIRQDLSIRAQESTIAHEFYHIILICEGYPHASGVSKELSKEEHKFLFTLGEQIYDCVLDPLIDEKTKALGFEPEIINHEAMGSMKNIPKFPPDVLANEGFQKFNGLKLCCYSFRKKYPSDDVESLWAKVSPDVVSYAHFLKLRIDSLSCDDKWSCFQKEKLLRDTIGYPVKLQNPITSGFE